MSGASVILHGPWWVQDLIKLTAALLLLGALAAIFVFGWGCGRR